LVLLAAALPAGVLTAVLFAQSAESEGTVYYQPKQPVPHSHAQHVGEQGLDCRYCHTTIETSDRPRATEAACLKCHQSASDDIPEFAAVRTAATGGPAVNWEKVNEVPAWITFNHARHVVRGVSCQSCHGRVDRMELTYQAEPLSMDWCMDCHRDPSPHLRRPEDVTRMGFKPPGGIRAYGHKVRNELGINPDNGCVYCHRPRANAPTLDSLLDATPASAAK
jgi:hypothetical protein